MVVVGELRVQIKEGFFGLNESKDVNFFRQVSKVIRVVL